MNNYTRNLYVIVFITGACVMVVEMCASRLIAPYFGTSMLVWANIIGLVLLALSVGYWIGGRVADKYPNMKALGLLPLTAGIFCSLIPVFSKSIFSSLSGDIMNTPLGIIAASFFSIIAVFIPPVFLLAMVSPYSIRLASTTTASSGSIAGKLYAFSTAGSLVGTFLPAFVLIPFVGTRETIILAGSLLILTGVLASHNVKWLLALLIPILAYFICQGNIKYQEGLLYEKDSLYQFVQIIEKADGSRELVYNEGGGIQSIWHPGDQLYPDSEYYPSYLPLPYLINTSAPAVAIIGSAGGTIPRLLNAYTKNDFPDMSIDAVEIDGEVNQIAEKYLSFSPDMANIITSDGRSFLNSNTRKYDIIIVDAYSNQIYIPFHLCSKEFFELTRRKLNEKGILAININATSKDSQLLQSFQKTLGSVYHNQYMIKPGGTWNYMLLASDNDIDFSAGPILNNNPDVFKVYQKNFADIRNVTAEDQKEGIILTDNRAPVEMMVDTMIIKEAAGRFTN